MKVKQLRDLLARIPDHVEVCSYIAELDEIDSDLTCWPFAICPAPDSEGNTKLDVLVFGTKAEIQSLMEE